MKTHIALLLSFVASAAFADQGELVSLRTLSGKTYRGVSVAKVDPDGVCFRHSNGAGKVLFSDMAADLKQYFGYDSKKAAAYDKELETRREKVRLAKIERDREIARAQTAAFEAAALRAARANVTADCNAAGGQIYGGGFLNAGWGVGGFVGGNFGYVDSLGGAGYYNSGHRTGTARMGVVGACAPVHEYGSSVARVGISTGYAPVHEYGHRAVRLGLSSYGHNGYRPAACAPVHEYGRQNQFGFGGIGGFYGYTYPTGPVFRQPYSPVMPGGRLANGVPSLGAGFSPSPAICAPGGGGAMFSAGR